MRNVSSRIIDSGKRLEQNNHDSKNTWKLKTNVNTENDEPVSLELGTATSNINKFNHFGTDI